MNRNTKKSAPPPRYAIAQVQEVQPVKAVHSNQTTENLERALPAALSELASVLTATEHNLCHLYGRLHRVLDPLGTDAPSDNELVGAVAAIDPPLVEIVYSLTRRLREVNEQQCDIIERLHI